ncbi:hypothetical protein QR680_002454 [Steinernema hermaphroditum]|uniref:Uncharacterized protein n=1 Tax=Steinernema hermaphroditum TaxID=289476 RepID=A0AA39LI67_9BILA|nr:hypothetical protein QR680_002454 [Steinernema hermaphroditum]
MTSVYREVLWSEEANERRVAARPTDQLVIERAPLEFHTTNNAFFQRQPLERTLPYSLTQQLNLPKGPFIEITSNSEILRGLPGDRFKATKAKEQLDPGRGLFEIMSVNRSTYNGEPSERPKLWRPKDQIERRSGSMQTRSLPIKQKGELQLSTEPFAGESTSRSAFCDPGPPDRFEMKKPKENLQVDKTQHFDCQTVSSLCFCGKSGERRRSKKHKEAMPRSTTPIDFSTYYKNAYSGEMVERPVQKKHNQELSLPEGSFEKSTTSMETFKEWDRDRLEKVNMRKPQQELELSKGVFSKVTTSSECFKHWSDDELVRVKPQKPKQEIEVPQGVFSKSTTNLDYFKEWKDDEERRIKPKKPKEEMELPQGAFSNSTTSLECFKEWDDDQIQRRRPKKPKEQLEKPSGTMSSKSAYLSQFQEVDEFERPPKYRPSDQLQWESIKPDFSTINQMAFTGGKGSAYRIRRPESQIKKSTEAFQAKSSHSEEFGEKLIERVVPIQPPAATFSLSSSKVDEPHDFGYGENAGGAFPTSDALFGQIHRISAKSKIKERNKSQFTLG